MVAVGDFIQWELNGQLQFEEPKQVTWVSDDRKWLCIDGSLTGIPVEEVINCSANADQTTPYPQGHQT